MLSPHLLSPHLLSPQVPGVDRLADADRVRLRSCRPQASRGAAATYYGASYSAPPTMRVPGMVGPTTAMPARCAIPLLPGVLPVQAERCRGCCGHDARRCGYWGGRHRGRCLGIGQARRRAQASDAAEATPGEPGASRRRARSPAWQGQREGQGQWRQLGGRRAGSVRSVGT